MTSPFEHYFAGEALYTRMVLPVCEKHGLTYMEFTVLLFLANNPQYDTAAEIVRCRRLTKSHVSLSVRTLTERGLLAGEYCGADRRSVHLRVLPGAEQIIEDGRAAQRRFGETLLEGFSDAEKAKLAAFMGRIDKNVARSQG